ncbi:MAG: hypothetical protein JF606_10160 [Burkholderiales bacterium]|nr:hypothetical protein [Burkholderiales bacterium]
MRRFSQLFNELDASTPTTAKVQALKRYFAQVDDADAAWAVYFLAGGKPRQVVPTGVLRALACQRAGIAEWLFEECYQAVGDLAETIAHVLPPAPSLNDVNLAQWVEQRLLPLRELAPEEQALRIAAYWNELDSSGRFLLTKLIGGGFRVGVSKLLVQRALAEHAGLDPKVVAQRMMGFTDKTARPSAEGFRQLISQDIIGNTDSGQPYPFFLAHAIEGLHESFHHWLGPPADWIVEWKYDGIRAQIVKRAGIVWIWSRGEELMTERFPEVVKLAQGLPDGTVLDGEILVWKGDAPAPFALLQQPDLYVRWTRGRWPLEQIFPLRGLKRAGLTHDKFMFAQRPRPLTPALSPKGRGSNAGQFAVARFEGAHFGSLSPGGGRGLG